MKLNTQKTSSFSQKVFCKKIVYVGKKDSLMKAYDFIINLLFIAKSHISIVQD